MISANDASTHLATAMSTRNRVRFSNALIATGKDRTGRAAAALLTLIGVPKDVVLEDYLSSNDYILPAYQDTVDAFVAAGGEPAIAPAILGVKKEYLDAAFEEMETRFGSIENYFSEGLDIDPAQQQALRDLYLGE